MSMFKKSPEIASSGDEKYEALLDTILYRVPGTDTDIKWADCVQGTLITGATGSGKSSGPGKYIAYAMLKSGFGFCILCGKPDERKRWERYAQETGRSDDIVILDKKSDYKFNFLEYEMRRHGDGAGEVLNAINALMNLNEQNRVHQSGGEGREEKFWDNSLRRLISRTIQLLRIAGEEVSIPNMRDIVSTCFQGDDPKIYAEIKSIILSPEQIEPARRKQAQTDLEIWKKDSYFLRLLEKINSGQVNNSFSKDEIRQVMNYWKREFPRISERTTSIIVESFMGIVEPFIGTGILRDHFSHGLSEELLPENIITNNKIVIIDFNVKEFELAGIYASTIYKSVFQSALERREVTKEPFPPKLSVLWVDEYQLFCNPLRDSLFQSTARSSWVATVYITQNLPGLYFSMGHSMPEARAKALLGNLNTKYFCSSDEPDTNEWASNMIGEHIAGLDTINIAEGETVTKTITQQIQRKILPSFFTELRTGRKENNFIVEAVVFKAGKMWRSKKDEEEENYAIVDFKQK